MTEIVFSFGGVEGEISVDERDFSFPKEGSDSIRFSVYGCLTRQVIETEPVEVAENEVVDGQVRRDPTDEEVVERLVSLFEELEIEYQMYERTEEEKGVVSKSLWTDYVHREHELRRRAEDLSRECDERVREAFREQVWPDDLNKSPSWQSDDDVTQETQEWVDAVFQMRDPLYDQYDDIPQAAALNVKEAIQDSLTQEQGWSLDSVVSRLEDDFDVLSRGRAKRIARQEISATLNQAEKISFKALPDDRRPNVVWSGPSDSSTTELCEEVKREVGDGVPLTELEDILSEKASQYEYGTPERVDQLVPHWQCRHQIDEA